MSIRTTRSETSLSALGCLFTPPGRASVARRGAVGSGTPRSAPGQSGGVPENVMHGGTNGPSGGVAGGRGRRGGERRTQWLTPFLPRALRPASPLAPAPALPRPRGLLATSLEAKEVFPGIKSGKPEPILKRFYRNKPSSVLLSVPGRVHCLIFPKWSLTCGERMMAHVSPISCVQVTSFGL